MNSTSGRLRARSAPAVPRPAPRASKAWAYWLIRSAAWPPVIVVSPRYMTGLSRCRLSADTIRWPLWAPTRMFSEAGRASTVMRPRLERVSVRGNPVEHGVEPGPHRVVHPGLAEVAGELLVEPARRRVRLGERSEVRIGLTELPRQGGEGVGDVAARLGTGDAPVGQPAGDGAQVAEVRRHGGRRGGHGLVGELVVDGEAATEAAEELRDRRR